MTEDQIQIAVIKWSQHPVIRKKYPELALLHHIANERVCTKYQGYHFKQLGVKSGVPDLHLPVARNGYHSLYIEMKSAKGKTSANQDYWLEYLAREGNCCKVCYSVNEAIDVLEGYLNEGK